MIEKSFFGDSNTVEFYRELPDSDSMTDESEKFLQDIVAFSNCSGGTIVLGIEDNGTVCGLGDASPRKITERVLKWLSVACKPSKPPIVPEIFTRTLENKTVLVLNIPAGRLRPYHLSFESKANAIYVRIGNRNERANDRRRRELVWEGQGTSYDQHVRIGKWFNEIQARDLCRIMYNAARDSGRVAVREMTPARLAEMGLLIEFNGRYSLTNAFMLMRGDNETPQARIHCAVYEPGAVSPSVTQEIRGPLYDQMASAGDFVLSHLDDSIPAEAVREVIANAVIHRSYMVQSDQFVRISVYSDRLEVLSPGTLFGLKLNDLGSGKSKCRNPAIAEALYYMGLTGEWGTGIAHIQKSCTERAPLFEEIAVNGSGFFRATLHRNGVSVGDQQPRMSDAPALAELATDDREVLAILRDNPGATQAELRKTSGFSLVIIRKILAQLLAQNRIERVGEGRFAQWYTKDQ